MRRHYLSYQDPYSKIVSDRLKRRGLTVHAREVVDDGPAIEQRQGRHDTERHKRLPVLGQMGATQVGRQGKVHEQLGHLCARNSRGLLRQARIDAP